MLRALEMVGISIGVGVVGVIFLVGCLTTVFLLVSAYDERALRREMKPSRVKLPSMKP
jgi:uncharacterized membrane protein YbaN (DUF454 family)